MPNRVHCFGCVFVCVRGLCLACCVVFACAAAERKAQWLVKHGLEGDDVAALARKHSVTSVFAAVTDMRCYEREIPASGLQSGPSHAHARHAAVSSCYQPMLKPARVRTTLRHEDSEETLER